MKTVPAVSRTSIVASLLPLALAGALLIPPAAGAGEETGKAILASFQEEILTVQEAKCRPVKPSAGVLSIPYTRLNVAVIDGIAFFRLVQIYHNHSDVNQGYAFTLPISPDTTITQFNLWDRGTRYAGSIEERPKAEAAYKETTGEEAPEMPMPRDPGLVRVGWNSYEMRVFPIFPGENKQIELFWHERLPMKNGEFFLNFPLRRLSASSDPRHPDAKSLLTEVTVSVQDDLPLVSFSSQSLPLKETAMGDRFRLLGGTFDAPETVDLSMRWVLKFPPEPSCRSMTFSAEGKNYFLTRVLVRMPEKGPQPLPAASPRAYYIGVWRDQSGGAIGENEMLESLGLELAAYSTGLILDPRDRFHCAWVPSNFPSAPGTAMTERLYRSDDKDREAVLRKLLGGPKKEPGAMKDLPDSIFSHLKDAVQKDGCRLVYIFCDPLTPASVERLSAIVDANPATSFFLITDRGKLPDALGRKNVFHYTLSEGWRRDDGLSSRDETFFFLDNERGAFSSLFFGEHNYLSLDLLWRRLPNLTPAVPMIAARGDCGLGDVSVYRPSQSRFRDAGYLPGEYALLWISGTFQRPGKETLEFHNLPRCAVPHQKWADPQELGLEYSYSCAAELPAGRSSHRFVGAFHARQVVRGLNMRVATKEGEIGKKKPDDPSVEAVRTEIDRLRKEIVRLSKEFSFVDTETAFIALPEELRKKYGFLEQKYSPGEIYGLEGLVQGIVPEPSTWLTIGLGLLGAVFFARKKISRGRQRG